MIQDIIDFLAEKGLRLDFDTLGAGTADPQSCVFVYRRVGEAEIYQGIVSVGKVSGKVEHTLPADLGPLLEILAVRGPYSPVLATVQPPYFMAGGPQNSLS